MPVGIKEMFSTAGAPTVKLTNVVAEPTPSMDALIKTPSIGTVDAVKLAFVTPLVVVVGESIEPLAVVKLTSCPFETRLVQISRTVTFNVEFCPTVSVVGAPVIETEYAVDGVTATVVELTALPPLAVTEYNPTRVELK